MHRTLEQARMIFSRWAYLAPFADAFYVNLLGKEHRNGIYELLSHTIKKIKLLCSHIYPLPRAADAMIP